VSRDPAPGREALRAALARSDPTRAEPGAADRLAAVALIVRPVPSDLALLFVRRAELPGDRWSGHMAFPGGHVDPSDADSIDTARRETHEELGIPLPRGAFVGRLDDVHPVTRRSPSIVVSSHVAWIEEEPEISPNYEIQYHLWVPLSTLHDPGARSELRLQDQGLERVFPSILYEGDTIWGLTHRVVENFLEVIGRAVERG